MPISLPVGGPALLPHELRMVTLHVAVLWQGTFNLFRGPSWGVAAPQIPHLIVGVSRPPVPRWRAPHPDPPLFSVGPPPPEKDPDDPYTIYKQVT